MPSLRLRDGLSWCLCQSRAVFLDIERDRYFCLSADRDAAFQRWAAGEPCDDAVARDALCANQLLIRDDMAGPPRQATTVMTPVRDLADAPGGGAWRDVMRAAIDQCRARATLRRLPLADILAGFAHAPDASHVTAVLDCARAGRIAAAFDTTARFLRAADQCLPRALAARMMCDRMAVPASIVFGVRLDPFAAHCWVQAGDAVIVGELEQARLFTPALVVA